jgi:hypothetical protein
MKVATIDSALDELRQAQTLPAPVRSWRVELGPDATGDSAVWVWITVDDELDFQTRNQLRELVRQTIGGTTEDPPWVYVRFRAASEAE